MALVDFVNGYPKPRMVVRRASIIEIVGIRSRGNACTGNQRQKLKHHHRWEVKKGNRREEVLLPVKVMARYLTLYRPSVPSTGPQSHKLS